MAQGTAALPAADARGADAGGCWGVCAHSARGSGHCLRLEAAPGQGRAAGAGAGAGAGGRGGGTAAARGASANGDCCGGGGNSCGSCQLIGCAGNGLPSPGMCCLDRALYKQAHNLLGSYRPCRCPSAHFIPSLPLPAALLSMPPLFATPLPGPAALFGTLLPAQFFIPWATTQVG